jgi:hypothetical protein
MGDYVYQQCSGFSAAAGLKNGQSDRKRNFGNVSYEDSVFTDT